MTFLDPLGSVAIIVILRLFIILGLAYNVLVKTNPFPELIFSDYALHTSLGTFDDFAYFNADNYNVFHDILFNWAFSLA